MPIQPRKRAIPQAASPKNHANAASHRYHANAYVLSAELDQPVEEDIKQQALVELPADGTYTYQTAPLFQLEGVVSYLSGYTQVAGHPSTESNGFTTLATSVIVDLNVLDVITADRVVAQISTEHPVVGRAPSVTFLGTRFDNLRIGGQKVEVDQDLHILGAKPPEDRSYFDDLDVLTRITKQYANIRSSKDLPRWADEQFRWDTDLVKDQGEAKFSIVNKVSGGPGTSFGHVIDLPHFGKIFLGELRIQSGPSSRDKYTFGLTMIRLELGSIAHGSANIAHVHIDSNSGGGGGAGNGGGPGPHGSGEGEP